jgi:hypothetical protein
MVHSMTEGQLREIAGTKRKKLPRRANRSKKK